ncbi:MAG: cytochrome c peroxidase [Maribacter sp.]|jgi:cytochrome c peroxidase
MFGNMAKSKRHSATFQNLCIMNRTAIKFPLSIAFASIILFSCAKDEEFTDNDIPDDSTEEPGEIDSDVLNLPTNYFNYANIDLPNYYETPPVANADNTPGNNQITDAGATLGRVLFYDANLSGNNTISCSSCHSQSNSFTDPDQFSTGFEGGLTGRNSMSLANARYYNNGRFFWDERAATLEDQVLMPIQDHVEMGMELTDLVPKLQALDYYPTLFDDAFGTTDVSSDRISRALAQFIRSMVSFESKYDEALASVNGNVNGNTQFANFTEQENLGYQIFNTNRGNCSSCHDTEAHIAPTARNNGMYVDYLDNGLGDVTGNANDNGRFKVPSLRNVALTAPYMHDGTMTTLQEVVQHYNSGVQAHPNLDNRLTQGNQPRRLNLNQQEQQALISFMNTLTDNSFITDEKYSDPFTGN